jgi:Protein of unknown function (DUF1549)/Protein of unknown function (DUF1553)/Planctomycete cytochrome C
MIRIRQQALAWKQAHAAALAVLAGLGASVAVAAESASGDKLWSAHIEPLLKEHCVECHSPAKPKSGLDLTSLQSILRGGDRGAAVIPGRADESNLYTFLRSEADPHMPPGKRQKLADDDVVLIRQWIEKLAGTTISTTGTNWSATNYVSTPAKPRIGWHPPTEMPPAKAIDRFLELAWKLDKITPAAPADDRTFVRRIHLDLVGRIPTREETEKFLRDRSRDKRAQLIDRLLACDEYPRHMREVFDPVLMDRRGAEWEDKRANQKWFAWLEDAFRCNRPWNEVVRDLIVARPGRPEDRGAVWFLYERENNAQAMAESLAPVVFGLQVKCAQCHDHMVAREIKQAHYWGMVAAFNRSKNVDTPAGPGVAESAIGGFVSFANLKKESQPARLVFFNGRSVDEPWPKEGVKETDSPELYVVPPPEKPTATSDKDKDQPRRRRERVAKADQPAVPKFSRRESFADAVTRDNPLLARALVNRIWTMLFGRGIVHPVDLMDSKHPPSQPELLDWLARDFERSGYDVKRLVRTLCNTRAFQLDSRSGAPGSRPARTSKSGRAEREPGAPSPSAFARALDKPLSAEQLYRSLLVATSNRADTNGIVAGRSEKELRRAFIKEFPALFPAEYNASLQQAMFLSNSELFDQLLAPRDGNLTTRLTAVPDEKARVREAFSAVFGRDPDAEELRECSGYLKGRSTEAGAKQLLWAMLTSAEFQVNH